MKTLQQIKQEAEKEFEEYILNFSGFLGHELGSEDNHFKAQGEIIRLKQFLSSQIEKAVAEALRSVLPEEKEIYAPEEVGHSPTHAIATNQHYSFNSCLSEIKAKIKSLGIDL